MNSSISLRIMALTNTSASPQISNVLVLTQTLGASLLSNDDVRLGRIRGIGGYADVYDAMMHVAETGRWVKVAVKRFRVILENDWKFAKVCMSS